MSRLPSLLFLGVLSIVSSPLVADDANSSIYKDAVDHAARASQDRERDASRQPEAILGFIQLEPGMTVIELGAGGGYTTELLSHTVGLEGKVYAQALEPSRVAGGKLPNVIALEPHPLYKLPEILMAAGFEMGSADAVLIFFALHDMYLNTRIDKQRLYADILEQLKPGGVLVILDNAAEPDSGTRDTRQLHRIGEQFIISEIQESGLTLDATSDVLRNPDDDLTKSWNSWRPAVPRGFQDRFALRFRKPE
jgi:predicted methyltransferase